MRILHVLSERGFSGGEVQLRYTLEGLCQQHDNRIVLQPGAQFEAVARDLGMPVTHVRMRNDADPLAWFGIRRAIARSGADLVHFACSRSHKLGAIASRGLAAAPKVVTRRMDYPLRHGKWSRWLYAEAVDAAVVISRGVQAELEKVGVPPERIQLIYEGVDPARFANLIDRRFTVRSQLGVQPEGLVVACGASLTRRKGQVHLMRAFARLVDAHPGIHLMIAGDGPERENLEREHARLGLQGTATLVGQVPIEDVLAAADIACMPSLREGLSVFCLEAAATGLPVVASRIGGLPESVADGESGLLVTPGDEGELASALERLVTDADLRRRLGDGGRQRVQDLFLASDMAAKTDAFYRELVQRRAGATAS